ncbi:MAG: hypothetical protein ACYSU0_13180, partial [Planctomycetota bacterium]
MIQGEVIQGEVDLRELSGRELAWVYKSFVAMISKIKSIEGQLAVMREGPRLFRGTRYEAKARKDYERAMRPRFLAFTESL